MQRKAQLDLFAYRNPLTDRLGEEFFKRLPREPGVYIMRDARENILYVGKAKDLRARLLSYKNARATIVSRKTFRLLKLIRSIETRLCRDEQDALLTENKLLRELKPPFNVVNTRPESYYFIAIEQTLLKCGGSQLRFRLTTKPEKERIYETMFGVFKGRGRTRDSFSALLRLLAVLEARDEGFYYPPALVRHRPPYDYSMKVAAPHSSDLVPRLFAFLHGEKNDFLEYLMELLLERLEIPRFIYHVVAEDLKVLEEFFALGPERVHALKSIYGIKGRLLGQDEVDDLLVLYGAEKKTSVAKEKD